MMANHGGRSGNTNRSSSTPVKWTLVEAEPETPEGRRGKQQGYGRSRGHGASGSGSVGSWRSTRDGGRGRGGGQGFSNGNRGNRRGGGGSRTNQGQGRGRGYGRDSQSYVGATYYSSPSNFFGNESGQSLEEQKAYMTNMVVRQIEFYFTVENLCRDIFMRSYMDEEVRVLFQSLFSDFHVAPTRPWALACSWLGGNHSRGWRRPIIVGSLKGCGAR